MEYEEEMDRIGAERESLFCFFLDIRSGLVMMKHRLWYPISVL